VDVLWLACSHTLPLSLLVEEPEEGYLQTNGADQSAEDGENGFDTGEEAGRACLEEQGSDNVSNSGSSVEEGHDDGFLGLSSGIGQNPTQSVKRHQHGIK